MKPPIVIDRTAATCPLLKKPCKKIENCAWRIEKQRQYPDGTIVQIKCCSVYLNADEHENSNNRLAALQKEMGAAKQAAIFQAVAMLRDGPEAAFAKNELAKLARKNLPAHTEEKGYLPDANR